MKEKKGVALFALMLDDPTPPSEETLIAAFMEQKELTRYDAKAAAHGTFGILIERASEVVALAVQAKLRAAGCTALIVPQESVTFSRHAEPIGRLLIEAPGIEIVYAMGQRFKSGWDQVNMVCFGKFAVDADITRTIRIDETMHGGESHQVASAGSRNHFKGSDTKFVLEIYADHTPSRFGISFPMSDLRTLASVKDLLEYTPNALHNRGAVAFIAGEDGALGYSARYAFEREARWLLWKHSYPIP